MGDDTRERPEEDRATETWHPAAGPSARIGHYRLVRLIATGGMGEVYEAEQDAPVRRRIALKLIKLGMDTRQFVARFESERQALALMNHPNIARVFDAGSTELGRPYFVMEHVPGLPITDYCDQHRLGIAERLELFIEVCEGVQHAHQKGIIHRDLKPSNVLVMLQDDRPVPKIIDFGLAKATGQRLIDASLLTQVGGVVGTPDYMSPEQADATGLDVDTRADVYSLGVLLYAMLAGTLPLERDATVGLEETLRRIREEDPTRPSARIDTLGAAAGPVARNRRMTAPTLVRELRGDLDWIVMKAIEKDRARRYASASELAADVRRHVRHEPVLSRPPRVGYRMGKFVRRHRTGVAAAGVVALALLLGLAGSAAGLVRARRAEAVARQEGEAAKQTAKLLEGLFQGADPGSKRMREILSNESKKIGEMKAQPLVQATLMTAIGRVYLRLGLTEEARPHLEAAYRVRRGVLGDRHADVARALNNLAILRRQTGDYERALETFRQALVIAEKTMGPDDPDAAYIMNCVGLLLADKGDYAAARPLLERSLAMRERIVGVDPSDLAQSLSNLALLHSETGAYDEARRLFERALAIDERTYGPDHDDVAADLNNLANLEQKAGAAAKARAMYERALAIREKIFGPEHRAVAAILSNLADLRRDQGDALGARPLYERALAIFEKYPEHPHLAVVLTGLAGLLVKLRDFDAARPLYERALAINQRVLTPDHPEMATTLAGYADLLRKTGRGAEAEPLEERVRAIRKATARSPSPG